MGRDRRLSLLDLDPLEVARQLTLKESALFKKISAGECFARARECPMPHDNFSTCIALANQVRRSVLSMSESNSKLKSSSRRHIGSATRFCIVRSLKDVQLSSDT
jgi:son of sevenless